MTARVLKQLEVDGETFAESIKSGDPPIRPSAPPTAVPDEIPSAYVDVLSKYFTAAALSSLGLTSDEAAQLAIASWVKPKDSNPPDVARELHELLARLRATSPELE